MSGRIRSIKPEWLEDELLAAASDEARVLSVALILMADDYGRGRASAAAIATGAWRYQLERDDGEHTRETLARASRALRELVAIRFVTVYEVAGQRYFEIRNWQKHQKVDRPSKPRIPEPPAQETAEISDEPRHSRDTRETLASPSTYPRETLATDQGPGPGPGSGPTSVDLAHARTHEGSTLVDTRRIETARRAVQAGYQTRRLSVPGRVATNAPSHDDACKLAGLGALPPDDLVAIIDGFFGDESMRAKGYPVAYLLANPNQWGRAAADAARDDGHSRERPAVQEIPPWARTEVSHG